MKKLDLIESTLIERLKKDDERAFQVVFETYQGELHVYCSAIVKIDEVAQDIVQEVFIRVWVNRHMLDPGLSLAGYIRTIARNLCRSYLRDIGYDNELKRMVWHSIQERKQESIPYEIEMKESEHLLQQAINRLPPQRKRCYLLSRVDGKTHAEIATDLNLSQNTVKNHIILARRDIQSYLKRYMEISFLFLAVLELLYQAFRSV